MWDIQNKERTEYLTASLMDSLHHLAELAKGGGLKYLLWEPMPVPRERPCAIDQAKALYERANRGAAVPIFYCIDWGHQCTYSATGRDRDPYSWIRELAPLSPVMHVQQTDGKMDRHWPFTRQFNQLEAIEQSGAREAILMLEIIHPFETKETQVLDDLKETVEYWKKYL
jgi:sugar phosphate isomerase/epimerase